MKRSYLTIRLLRSSSYPLQSALTLGVNPELNDTVKRSHAEPVTVDSVGLRTFPDEGLAVPGEEVVAVVTWLKSNDGKFCDELEVGIRGGGSESEVDD